MKPPIEFENEVKAHISADTGMCSSVQILSQHVVPFGPAKVNEYLKRDFPPRRAVAACIGWKESRVALIATRPAPRLVRGVVGC